MVVTSMPGFSATRRGSVAPTLVHSRDGGGAVGTKGRLLAVKSHPGN
jgi:hypothetical protein